MRIFLTGQQHKLQQHLSALQRFAVHEFEKEALAHKCDRILLPGLSALPQTMPPAMATYRIFPDRILTALPQWIAEQREMRVGDTIAQLISMPPTRYISTQSLVGVRISAVDCQPNSMSFAYQTLQGHVEMGESRFRLYADEGKIWFEIETWSAPSGVLPEFTHPFAGIYQNYCTQQALKRVARNMDGSRAAK